MPERQPVGGDPALGRNPTADEQAGMQWWNSLDEHARRKWMRAAGDTGVAADAWTAFKRTAGAEATASD